MANIPSYQISVQAHQFSMLLCRYSSLGALLLSSLIAAAWYWGFGDSVLWDGWWKMQLSTTALGLMLGFAIARQCLRPRQYHWLDVTLASATLALAIAMLVGFFQQQPLVLGGSVIHGDNLYHLASTSPQSAIMFLSLAIIYLLPYQRSDWLGVVEDVLLILMVSALVFFFSGHLFNAQAFIGLDRVVLISIPTLTVLSFLTIARITQRIPYSIFSVLVASGGAGKLSRMGIPLGLVVGFFVTVFENALVKEFGVPTGYSSALSASVLSVLMFLIIITMAQRIRLLEGEVILRSFRDELTGLYNLAGLKTIFKTLGITDQQPVFLVYFDVDGLKKVNDQHGHETGSNLLAKFANLLRRSFRDDDIIARVGGDEFVVCGEGSRGDAEMALKRYLDMVAHENAHHQQTYEIKSSYGVADTCELSSGQLKDLMKLADQRMYAMKVANKASQTLEEAG